MHVTAIVVRKPTRQTKPKQGFHISIPVTKWGYIMYEAVFTYSFSCVFTTYFHNDNFLILKVSYFEDINFVIQGVP